MLSLNYSEERRAFYGNGTFPCLCGHSRLLLTHRHSPEMGNDSNLLIVFYVQIMPDDFVMQLH
ncbi:hypothetical protein MZF59_24035, partial [Escherichia coli]|nr:hypothetical protein [Escherichia coli]